MDGLVYKIIITTYSPLILACWFNRLYKKYSKDKILYYIASMSNIKKAKARQTFNINNFKWILFYTFILIKLSINLQYINYTIMVKPSHKLLEIK